MAVTTRSKRRLSYSGSQISDVDQTPSRTDTCALCKQTHQYMSTVHTWQSTKARDAVGEYGITLQDTVCRPCRDDLRRIAANPDIRPRWEKEKNKCCVKDCTNACFAHSKVIDSDNTKRLVDNTNLQFENDSIPFPAPLCAQHYHIAYDAVIRPKRSNCPTCGISLRHAITRPCPNADLIREHLTKTTGFNGCLSLEDKVCFACYKSHISPMIQRHCIV